MSLSASVRQLLNASDGPSKLNLYSVLHSLPDGVTLANRDGRIVFSNEAADRILGIGAATDASPTEWTEHYGVFLPDRETPFPTDQYPLVRALAGEHTRDVEMFIRNSSLAGGALIAVSGQPLRDDHRAVIGAAVVFRDITELRETQQELEETVETLARTQRLKDELAAFVVHDLKNPLAGILTTCELLALGEFQDDAMRSDIEAIRGAAQRMQRMVMDLLDIQMAEDGALELEPSNVPVARLLLEVAEASRPRLAGRRQRIEVADVGELSVLADEDLLSRVLMNLADNCAKYGPQGGMIRMDATEGQCGTVVIGVSDEGPGVRPELRERIFEKYTKVEREDGMRSQDSRGLGLRFCKVVVDAHEGRVWVEDGVPRGARFCVELAAAGEA